MYGLAANVIGARNLTATYTIDGVTQTRRVAKETFDSLPMTELFHASGLSGGTHNLRVNLTDVAYPQAFGIDFVAYNSSVNSISSLPGYSGVANASTKMDSGKIGLNGGAIAGTVVGVVGCLGLLIAGFFFWRRFQQAKGKQPVVLGSSNSSYDDIEATSEFDSETMVSSNWGPRLADAFYAEREIQKEKD